MKKLIFLLMPFLLCRCASIEKSVGLGVGIGAASGIAASQIAHYNTKGTVVLGLSGAVIGGVLAALLHKNPPETSTPVPAVSVLKGNSPPLKNAEQDAIWVPDKIEGDRFEEGHRVFLIKKPAHWQLKDGDSKDADEAESNSHE